MTDLAGFLLARIDEDEALATRAESGPWHLLTSTRDDRFAQIIGGATAEYVADLVCESDAKHIARQDPARVLAECEANRRIIEWFHVSDDPAMPTDAWTLMKRVLEALALPYADHPDYRQEWKP